jgi:hypothetical protein
MPMNKIYLFADRDVDGSYTATEIIKGSLEDALWKLEYGDVVEGKFQIWEYPVGKTFQVESDRVLVGTDYYATPNKSVWLPKIKEIGSNKEKVAAGHDRLVSYTSKKSPIRSILSALKRLATKD